MSDAAAAAAAAPAKEKKAAPAPAPKAEKPAWIAERNAFFDVLKERRRAEAIASNKEISITSKIKIIIFCSSKTPQTSLLTRAPPMINQSMARRSRVSLVSSPPSTPSRRSTR